MNMEIDKDKMRALVENGKIPQALQQIGDISHFLGKEDIQEEIVRLTTQYRSLNPAVEEGDPEWAELKTELLALIERLPADFESASPGAGNKGCLGIFL